MKAKFPHLPEDWISTDTPSRHFPGGISLMGRVEDYAAGSAYRWDGLQRGVAPGSPLLVFQMTLEGWGIFEQDGRAQRVEPGGAFLAVVPSAHVYHLPPESPGWRLLWLIVRHPYIVPRLDEQARRGVFALPPDSPLFRKVRELMTKLFAGKMSLASDLEEELFQFLFACERHRNRLAHPPDGRREMLDFVEREVGRALPRALSVEDLSSAFGMSRSHFSHWFQARTGLSPAAFMTRMRLREAERRLMQSNDILEGIARDTGFADANLLCRVFRRHYGMTPGAYRRRMRIIPLPL